MEKELISVIVTTYKRSPAMVLRAIKSIQDQSYKNLEIIVVDDSPKSYDKRKKVEDTIFKLGDNRIKYLKNKKNLGACLSRNIGIKMSKGNFIAFLDDDDQWKPNKLMRQMEIIQSDSSIGLVYCRQVVIDEIKNKEEKSKRKCFSGYVFDQLLFTNFIGSTSFPLIRKDCFEQCGMFNEDILSQQDWELWLRISLKYKIEYVDDFLVNYYIHLGERIGTNFKKQIQGHMFITNMYNTYLSKHTKLLSIRMIRITPFYIKEKLYKDAFKMYFKAIKIAPYNLKYNIKYLFMGLLEIFRGYSKCI